MLVGEMVGKYSIIRELGRGGMGTVYLAEDTSLGRPIALKILNPHLSLDESFLAGFRQEARAVASLSHPGIVRIHNLETLGGQLVIDMEYVDGPTLDEYLSRSPLQPHEAVDIAGQVLDALAVCHAQDIVHRDVKPSNILVSRDRQALLADFGLATAYASHLEHNIAKSASSSMFVGTPRYAPIEAWDGARPTPAWDVYSVGVILHEALTGCALLSGTSPLSMLKEMLQSPLVPLKDRLPLVSEELSALVMSMLDRNAQARPVDAAVALSRLRETPEWQSASRTGLTTLNRLPSGQSSRVRRLARNRRRRLFTASMLGLAMAGLALGAYLWSRLPVETANPEKTAGVVAKTAMVPITAPLFFDVSILETGERQEACWMMTAARNGEPSVIVASGKRSLWLLRTTQAGSRLSFNGDWAEYQDDGGGHFHSGTIKGLGEWTVPNRSLMASLQFHTDQDNSSRTYSISAAMTESEYTQSSFLARIENEPLIQPLLYLELMPRHLPWASYIEGLLPSLPESRIDAPILGASGVEVTVDGDLSEAVWRKKYYSERGRIGEIRRPPNERGSVVLVRATPTAVLLGVRVLEIPPGQRLSMTLDLCPAWSIPVSRSARFQVDLASDGAYEASSFRGDAEAPWQCDWRIQAGSKTGYWSVEIEIPVEGLGISQWPDPEKAWRMNIAVFSLKEDGQLDKTVALWGSPNIAAVEHGVLVHFVKPKEEQPKP